MPVEVGAIAPWLDNWPVYRQLWQGSTRNPGDELNLVPTLRNLTVQWRSVKTGSVVLASSELQTHPYIRVFNQERGVVEINLSGDGWNYLPYQDSYIAEIIAYGYLYDSFPWGLDMPLPQIENLSGQEVYGAPREILELIGRIPGADVEMGVPLMGGWTLDARGYWTKTILKTQPTYGIFVNDAHAREVSYADLALGSDRQYARVQTGETTDTLYYKGKENLADPLLYVETAHNRYVLRCLQEATAEFNRKTGTFFNKQRVYRETHRGKYRMGQLALRAAPVEVDRYFRVDCFSFSRDLVRRYTEAHVTGGNFYKRESYFGSQTMHVDSLTGIITLAANFFDWVDWSNNWTGIGGTHGFSFFVPGENNIETTYTAGYDSVPTDVAEAVVNMAAIRQGIFWQQSITQGLSGVSIGCANLNFGEMFQKWFPGWQQGADAIATAYQRQMIEAF